MDLNLTPVPVDAPTHAEAVAWAGFSWEEARGAIERHEQGSFWISAQLATQAKRYAPIKAAAKQRAASPKGLPWAVEGPERRPGLVETEACRALWRDHVARLLGSMLDDVAFLGFSVLQHPTNVDAEGRRYVVSVDRYPAGAVGYTTTELASSAGGTVRGYYAIDAAGGYHQLPRPGETDGFWTLVADGDRPHLDGAITALDTQYVAGSIAERARANVIVDAGRASPVYEMPVDVPTNGPEGKAAQATIAGLGTRRTGAVLPGGGELSKYEPGSQTYAFFAEALRDRITMVELALLGRGGTTAKPDAQYQPASGIQNNVPEDLIRADVTTIERSVGALFALLARLNQNLPADRAPRLHGNLPDTDQAAKRAAEQAQRAADDAHRKAQLEAAALAAAQVKTEREAGLLVDDARIATIYALAGVEAAKLPPASPPPTVAQGATSGAPAPAAPTSAPSPAAGPA